MVNWTAKDGMIRGIYRPRDRHRTPDAVCGRRNHAGESGVPPRRCCTARRRCTECLQFGMVFF